MTTDTIFALATAPGRAAIAVVRLSGPGAGDALRTLAGRLPKARQAAVRRLRAPGGAAIDDALCLWFPAPASYTGEDCAELHLHGGMAVVEAAQAALLELGLRLAEPGEFTRRAFENGKLDLAQAEGVADLIDAQTTAQAGQALAQLGGALSRRHEAWRADLIEALAMLEAAVDFPDEEVPADVTERGRRKLVSLRDALDLALADSARGQRVREGYRIAVIGAPNAGKSSLFNLLVAREAAIVAPSPGTTRDVIEAPLSIAGYAVLLADTAGVRETDEAVEAEGVRRARDWAHGADLRIWVIDGSADDGSWRYAADLVQEDDLCLVNKADRGLGNDGRQVSAFAAERALEPMTFSAADGSGLERLHAVLTERVVEALSSTEFPSATRQRHVASLTAARDRLNAALDAGEVELAAEDVRLAARALGRITGAIDSEDVLGMVFGTFCIGK